MACCFASGYTDRAVTASFMRQFYALQKILQKRPTRRSILLAGVTLCKTVEGEVLRVNERDGKGRRSRQAQEHPGAAGVIRIVEYAFQLLCRALGKLSGTEDGHDAGQLTYHLVCLYDAVMKALQKRCEVMAQQETVRSNAKPAKQKTKSLRSREVHTLGRASSGDETATQMAQLLRTMGSSLNISCREHQELLEGFLFILLARVGKILCLFVFQDLQLRPDLYVDPTKLRLPAGLAGVDVNDASLLAAQIESKHLIWLLERMLAVMNSASLSTSEGVNRAGFVSKTKARLQNTLLQAVFGTDQPLFQQSLQRPPEPDVADQPEPEVEKLTPDWFVQEVWRLLGWEMLKTVD